MSKPMAICLMGPTAAGKTALAVELHKRLNVEIISVDSAQVYRGLDIGSAKPTEHELREVPHRLINIRDPWQVYSAADFCRDAKGHIEEIVEAGKTPLLVGGTMMYFKALLDGLSDLPEADDNVRREIESTAGEHGWPEVHKQLARVDPQAAQKIHPNHSQRISRALEVYRITGIPMSDMHQQQTGGLIDQFDWRQIAVSTEDRAILHKRIASRFLQMLELGFVDEVKALRTNERLHKDLPSIRAVGYRQVWEYLDGDYSFPEMKERAIAATRQLAKRQLTWLRKWQEANWLFTDQLGTKNTSFNDFIEICLKFLSNKAI